MAENTPKPNFGQFGANATPAPKPTPVKKPTVAKKKQETPLDAVLSFGQSVINVASTPLYAVTGFLNESLRQNNTGEADLLKRINAAGENATSWTVGKKTVTGVDLLKTGGVIGAKGSGRLIEQGTPAAFIAGLASDVVLDPTTYVGLGLVKTAIKTATNLGRDAIKAGVVAAGGNVAERVAVKEAIKAGKEAEQVAQISKAAVVPEFKAAQKDKLYKFGRKYSMAETPAGEIYRATQAKITEGAYKTVKLEQPVSFIQKINNVVASSVDAGVAGAKQTLAVEAARKDITKFAVQEAKAVRKAAKAAGVEGANLEGNVARTATGDAAKVQLSDGSIFEFPKFKPYKADDGRYYVSDNSNMWSFPNAAAAKDFIKAEAKKANTAPDLQEITGLKPIVDTTPLNQSAGVLAKLPATTSEAKKAQKNLNLAQQIAQAAIGTVRTEAGKATRTKYSGIEDLAAGLRAGHSVSTPRLLEILDALDPERQWTRDISKLGKKEGNAFLADLLTTTGIQTAAKIQQRIDALNATALLKATGAANAEEIGLVIQEKLNPTGSALSEFAQSAGDASRQASIRRLNQARIASRDDFERIGVNINTALSGRFDDIKKIEDLSAYWEGITSLGDLAVRNTSKAFAAGSRAILKQQLNQSFEAKLVGSILGLSTWREAQKAIKLTEKEIEYFAKPPKLRMAQFIEDMKLAEDYLKTTLNSRIVQSKNVKDPEFKKAFATDPKAAREPHFVFLHLGDVMSAFDAVKKSDLMHKAFFPVGEGIVQTTDSMSYIGMNSAVRHVLELTEKNMPIDRSEVLARLMSRHEKQAVSSPAFMKTVEKTANKIADELVGNPELVKILQETHKVKLLAAADEAIFSAENLSRELFDNLIEGWRKANGEGFSSEATRIKEVRKLFARFVYLSDAFRNQGSEVAESVLRASALVYMNGGKLKNLLERKITDPTELALITGEYEDFIKTVNTLYKHDEPAKLIGDLPRATPAQYDKITSKLSEAEILYETRLRERIGITTKGAFAAWKKTFEAAQRGLDNARAAADKFGIPTKHWSNSQQAWVDSARYDRQLEARLAVEDAGRVVALEDGVVPVGAEIVDSVPTAARRTRRDKAAAIIEEWKQKNIKAQMALRQSDSQEVSAEVLALEKQVIETFSNPADQAQYMQHLYNSNMLHKGQILVTHSQLSDVKLSDANKFTDKGAYVGKGGIMERINARSGRQALYPYLVQTQSKLNNAVQSAAHYMQVMLDKYGKALPDEAFDEAFAVALAGKASKSASPVVVELGRDLRQAFDAFFGPDGAIAGAGLDGKTLQGAFARFGLSDMGVPNVRDWTPERLMNLLKELPFGAAPSGKNVTTLEKEAWKAQRQAFESREMNGFLVMSRILQAIEFAKMEKNMAQTFSHEFSYIAEGLTYAEAVKRGYVEIKNIGGVTDLSAHLPKPAAGGLYHPDIAKQFASINREINVLYNSKRMPQYVNTAMELLNAIKATQTLFAPRHHVTNFLGDTMTAVIGGARDVRQWAKGYQLSTKWAVERGQVDYDFMAKNSEAGDKLANSLARAVRHMQGKPNQKMAQDGAELTIGATVNGKFVQYSDAEFMKKLEDWAIIVGNQIISDQRGLQESITATFGSEVKGELLRNMTEKFNLAATKVERPVADFAAAYGNGPRIASALHIMQSKSWTSEAEMFAAMTDHVMRYHPSIYSLAATERKYARLAFTYYTWIRGAHNALLDMALNHTSAMTLYSKAQYQAAVQAGMDPMSIGVPWENKQDTPGYYNYSTYGPTAQSKYGQMLFKPPVLPLDVMDTWNIQFDPTQDFIGNVSTNVGNVGQGAIAKNLNLYIQPVLETLTKTDPSTGKPSQVKDFQSFMDKAVGQIGFTSPLIGLGLYTPANKGPDSKNPITQEQRDLKVTNWLGLTQKGQYIQTPATERNAAAEVNARLKRIAEQRAKEQGK